MTTVYLIWHYRSLVASTSTISINNQNFLQLTKYNRQTRFSWELIYLWDLWHESFIVIKMNSIFIVLVRSIFDVSRSFMKERQIWDCKFVIIRLSPIWIEFKLNIKNNEENETLIVQVNWGHCHYLCVSLFLVGLLFYKIIHHIENTKNTFIVIAEGYCRDKRLFDDQYIKIILTNLRIKVRDI